MKDVYCSIIIPCYNEQEVLAETHTRLTQVLSSEFNKYEILYINDGSKDRTLSILKELCNKDSHSRGISFSRNFGHQAAVSAGIRHCNGDIALIMDADLQDPPECIPDMVQKWKESGAEVVLLSEKKEKGKVSLRGSLQKFSTDF